MMVDTISINFWIASCKTCIHLYSNKDVANIECISWGQIHEYDEYVNVLMQPQRLIIYNVFGYDEIPTKLYRALQGRQN